MMAISVYTAGCKAASICMISRKTHLIGLPNGKNKDILFAKKCNQ